jgi:hypothetical protein
MSDISPFTASRDAELGSALRDALEAPHPGAFVTRVRARMGAQGRAWEDELASWFWQGLVAASLATLLAGWSWTQSATVPTAEASVASELLTGDRTGTEILLVAMRDGRR